MRGHVFLGCSRCCTRLGTEDEARGPGGWLDTTSLVPPQKAAPGSCPRRVPRDPEAVGWGMELRAEWGNCWGHGFFVSTKAPSLPPSLSLTRVQGEDGFPGFKGDMGIKGDRVSVPGRGASLQAGTASSPEVWLSVPSSPGTSLLVTWGQRVVPSPLPVSCRCPDGQRGPVLRTVEQLVSLERGAWGGEGAGCRSDPVRPQSGAACPWPRAAGHEVWGSLPGPWSTVAPKHALVVF